MNRSGAVDQGERPTGGGVLYVVATPIGNLSDVTLRALQVLGDVPLIAAEDTRLTKRLLDRHGLTARLTSFHAKSGPGRLATLLDHLRSGSDLALVTDAGTPAVSDPGEDLVSAWSDEGGRVVPIPGASAVLAAVTASGLAGPRWSFEGFLPRSGRARRDHLERIAADTRGCVLFEAPNRVAGTLDDLAAACGPERSGAVCRELTKIHEQIVRAPLRDLAAATADGTIPSRGEIVIVVGGIKGGSPGAALSRPPGDAASDTEQLSSALEAVERLVAAGTARGEAARRVAAETGIPRRRLYRAQG
ncbi:MAG: 16S rRNA (cytidine(1402)-2'-O)-methyltransferase [Chloroflexota bacterium]|nr:16S rRNA (cytidine(1402)-2'-O)-methyltransferase [Chloroflexota bacterium]MDH5244044.1 16S rRNA (cytidine(1402)-2'-O)-methyltransferase [Chloroflexota bacterium]